MIDFTHIGNLIKRTAIEIQNRTIMLDYHIAQDRKTKRDRMMIVRRITQLRELLDILEQEVSE